MARWNETLDERFWKKVEKQSDCWEWRGARTKKGYGVMWMGDRLVGATVISMTLAEVPKTGPFVLHSCDNKSCVRPDHLRWGTAKENTADMIQRGRAGWLRQPEVWQQLAADMRAKR